MTYQGSLARFKGQLNSLSDRGAMGLPEYYTSGRLEGIQPSFDVLRKSSRDELVSIAESNDAPFAERYTAGAILSLLGDPRINIFNPEMIVIPGCITRLGLEPEKVDQIVRLFEETGIIPEWIEKETPAFEVEIRTFKIAKYPVTNLECLAFLKENTAAEIPSSWRFGRYPFELANHPVHTVSAESADAYAAWLSEKTGRSFRLPSEYEWEYAAAGAERLEFPWGDQFLDDHANTIESGILGTTPVGIFPKGYSRFGVADMAGNVEEYVADLYRPYPSGKRIEDDLSHSLGTYRVARGGSFTRFRDLARCKRRHGRFPRDIYVMGFRLAEDV
ncbi:formylglycine-generating enzyme family protein [Brevibacillus humidisoli]|uniref:formylglycine-generating enzyme family protein n=1 Tax=Brevibacillus humidisoli TaxID=2895522 RepID=UPI001E649A54|nr:SUMF1/EgtB/PvdO family nonheme iron enzyme [Brevibacillus humidisoli]UFJ43137.1 formylglycine-generating enzyme family protein [Brevibacillus humidisoli]